MFDLQKNWPKLLFFGTVAFGLFFLVVNTLYESKNSILAYNRQLFDQYKNEYDQNFRDLSSRLTIRKTIPVTISAPIVIQQCRTFFNRKFCNPVTQMAQRQIEQAVDVPDPNIQKQLDALTARLGALSAESQTAQSNVDEFKPFYDFVQNMMRPIISLIAAAVSLFVILSNKYKADVQKWAFGSFGTVLGFWLK